MAKRFQELRAGMAPERQKRAHERAQEMLAELPLRELRQARHLTQEALARVLRSNQALVSKLERRADMYVSSLRSYIEAMGGELEIIARFPDGAVRIRQFEEIGRDGSPV
ncbi:MAG: XRE family transcriptional regulator [Gemmatimonadetes bacterium]|nr:XRE family transcriptional regulator [Gemmatimonadota bacterium]MBI2404350.1 XRE family transcriptional regulator [Gemmatimonadota bacterium]